MKNENTSKTILITGVAGLLGSRFAEWILDNTDWNVIGIDNLTGGYIDTIQPLIDRTGSPRFNFWTISCEESDAVDEIFSRNKIDYVIHFAAYAAEGLSPFIRCYNYTNNLLASANIINKCIKYNVKRLVFTSSMAVYGNQDVPFDETQVPNPIDPYGVAKYACEMDIQIAGEQHGLDWCIIRPHNVYGANQNIFDSYRNFIGIAMYKVLHDDPITIYGDGMQTRAFSYIDDALEPLYKAVIDPRASKQIINLGGTVEYTIRQAAEMVMKAAGKGTLKFLPPRHEVKHAWSTWQKSIDLLDFEQKTSLEDGILKMYTWVKSQQDRPRQIWETYEITNGIYEYWKPEALKDGYYKTEGIG